LTNPLDKALTKLKRDGADDVFCAVFAHNFSALKNATSPYIREDAIEPLVDAQEAHLHKGHASNEMASQTAIIKLNGGLGTSMGLDKAKSLLEVKDGYTFLDVIIHQVERLRSKYHAPFPLMFMNSFNTSADTISYIKDNHAEFFNKALGENDLPLEFVQHREPKLLASTYEPAAFPEDPELEWCPPGHGDFYAAFYGSRALERLLSAGFKYAFVSNSDNLGAVFDAKIANYFEESDATIMLELASKTEADVKGGHIVLQDGKMMLREVAQIHPDDMQTALDISRHPYFNTNSLWLNLEKLHHVLKGCAGVLDLPLIVNKKRLRPKDDSTPEVIQLETAIGAAISVLDDTTVISAGRERFLPVKLTSDLEELRSPEYALDADFNLRRVAHVD
jgi:UTP--glucose-1-phosphate uridylyltransferase